MSISIVTPCFNAERLVPATLQSIQAQTFTDWEHVTVNDGSADRTLDVLQAAAAEDSRRSVLSIANRGLSEARNAGMEITDSSRKYVIFIDSDDTWEPDTLQRLHDALEANPDCVAAHGLARYMGDSPTQFQPVDMEEFSRSRETIRAGKTCPVAADEPTAYAGLCLRNWIATPGQVLIRRSALDSVGLFDHIAGPAADWDLWLRLARLSPLHFENHVVLNYRIHPNNMSHAIHRMAIAARYVRLKTIRAPENTDEQRRLAILGMRLVLRDKVGDKLHLARQAASQRDFRGAARQITYTGKPLVELFHSYTSGH